MLQPNQDLQMQGKVSGADWGVIYPKQKLNYGDFTERLWAYLTIQQLLEKRWVHLSLCRSLTQKNCLYPVFYFLSCSDVGTLQEQEAIRSRARNMSLQYSFVTPLSSMVVTKPETKEGANRFLVADKLTEGKGDIIS